MITISRQTADDAFTALNRAARRLDAQVGELLSTGDGLDRMRANDAAASAARLRTAALEIYDATTTTTT